MSQVNQQDKFACSACGRKYAWKPELAGRKVKCKCGAVIQAPTSVTAAPAASAPAANPMDNMYDIADDAPAAPPPRAKAAAPAARAGSAPAKRPAAAAPVEDTGYRCPSCKQAVQPGEVICVNCGYNFKTGKKMNTEAGAGPMPAVAGAPARAGQHAQASSEYDAPTKKGGMSKGIFIGLGLVILVGALLGGMIMIRSGGGFSFGGPKAELKGEDKEALDMMHDEGWTEVIEWLNNDPMKRKQVGMTMPNHTIKKYVEEWYGMGVKKVYAYGEVVSLRLCIELPDEPDKRAAIFAWQKRWHNDQFKTPVEDVGQKYLLMNMEKRM